MQSYESHPSSSNDHQSCVGENIFSYLSSSGLKGHSAMYSSHKCYQAFFFTNTIEYWYIQAESQDTSVNVNDAVFIVERVTSCSKKEWIDHYYNMSRMR